jgi:hypothetical protein
VSKAPSTINADQAAINDARATKARVKAPPSTSPRIGRAFEGFLEMPVRFVLVVMWLAGAALMGSCGLALYLAVSALI